MDFDDEEYRVENPDAVEEVENNVVDDVDDDDDNQAEEEALNTPPKKKRKSNPSTSGGKKAFQTSWMLLDIFKGWLRPCPNDPYTAICTACDDKKLKSGKSELERHAATGFHLKKVNALKGQKTLDAFSTAANSARQKHVDAVKSAEIKLASFFVDHNVAFLASDHLAEVQKQAFPDSKIAKDMTLGRDKCNAIVRNVIADVETEEIVKDLQTNLFSVMVDESTDSGSDKNLCVVVNYIYPKSKKPRACLLELVRLDAKDCSAAKLWEAFEQSLQRLSVPVTNVVALACDSCNTMVGQYNSFWSRLKAACPWALLLPCACHSVAKVSEKACSELPDFVQDHLRKVATYLTGSPKRSKELMEFQEYYQEELKKIIKPSGTRWLVLHQCVAQYLKIRKSLLAFFELRVFEDARDKTAQRILQDLKNPYTHAYMEFLNYALDFTNEFNALFQSNKVMIHKLAENSQTLMENLCQNFIKSTEMDRIATMDLAHPDNQLPLEKLYLGPGCKEVLDNLPPYPPGRAPAAALALQLEKDKETFKAKCRDFYVRAAKELRERLPLNDPIFKEMAFIDPEKLLSHDVRSGSDGLSDLPLLCSKFKEKLQLDSNALATEWRKFPNIIKGAAREKLLKMTVEEAWVEIGSMKNGKNDPMFPELTKLANLVMILPHANAESERVFSVVTDVRTKKRNRLGIESLNAICVSRVSFRSKGIDCTSFKVTNDHLRRHNTTMYARK
ncbi:zinc finger BED domain-containing protein 5-like [Thrips palmi]|uniref:Zinc finger BED domain-containing protein 5-like n=1 Tax=Thrips palmi TaxID=161013 RepID=A0A6P8YVC6_THRPL|nr:zinc finger BED domain-containing protein 5-like [Thrips palmi]